MPFQVFLCLDRCGIFFMEDGYSLNFLREIAFLSRPIRYQ